jgi:hypothetical protein
MKQRLTMITAITALLFLVSATVSAQEKKIERKMTIITMDDGKKTVVDTTIILNDTKGSDLDEFIFKTREGKVIRGTTGATKMVIISDDVDLPGETIVRAVPNMEHMRVMSQMNETSEGVNYRISVDGVTVNIKATKGKTKEADRILEEVKKILITK